MNASTLYAYFDGSKAGLMEGDHSAAIMFRCRQEEFEKQISEYKSKGFKIIYIDDEDQMERRDIEYCFQ
jgi:hypothetical protein